MCVWGVGGGGVGGVEGRGVPMSSSSRCTDP